MICEICRPKKRGYTVYFAEDQNLGKAAAYFQYFSKAEWKPVNSRMFWATEKVFFDFIDYAKEHLHTGKIFGVLSDVLDPLNALHLMKSIDQFGKERETSWIDELIENNAISTHYQPIAAMEQGELQIVGHELLSRGRGKDGKIISPYHMFEAAQVRNRVFSLDRACRLQAVRNAGMIKNQLIFINFIPTAIYVPEHCLATTFQIVKEMNIKPEQIVFEVIETEEVEDLEHLKNILNYYRSHGFKYALDDVGTGFNSLEKLREMKPDFVKLAIEFTNGVRHDPAKQKVAKEVLAISHQMGALALAEGVEEKEDLLFLAHMGYDLFQGYYLAKPQPEPVEKLAVQTVLG